MNSEELTRPTVPIGYLLEIIQISEERGVKRGALLDGTEISGLLEQPEAKISLLEFGAVCQRALSLTKDASLGYEFGLRSNATIHGFYGLGFISQRNLREAVDFGIRFSQLRIPGWELHSDIDGDDSYVEARERFPFGPIRQFHVDMLLTSLANSYSQAIPIKEYGELWFDTAEPEHYAKYKDRLPRARFNMPANQIRMPSRFLDIPLTTANEITARLVARECERELALTGHDEDLLERIRAAITQDKGRYPDLDTVARRLFMSTRTLKRQIQQHGSSFQTILNDIRAADSVKLLKDPTLTIEDVAARMGYTSPPNFIRAFKKWMGKSPKQYRLEDIDKH